MSEHTRGPWMVGMQRDCYGRTTYAIYSHTHAAICVDKDSYWLPEHECITDDDGYYQPDEAMDCAPHRIANARLIAAAPELLEALVGMLDALPSATTHPAIQAARAAIAKAKGDVK